VQLVGAAQRRDIGDAQARHGPPEVEPAGSSTYILEVKLLQVLTFKGNKDCLQSSLNSFIHAANIYDFNCIKLPQQNSWFDWIAVFDFHL
jgi:hypothetical protein